MWSFPENTLVTCVFVFGILLPYFRRRFCTVATVVTLWWVATAREHLAPRAAGPRKSRAASRRTRIRRRRVCVPPPTEFYGGSGGGISTAACEARRDTAVGSLRLRWSHARRPRPPRLSRSLSSLLCVLCVCVRGTAAVFRPWKIATARALWNTTPVVIVVHRRFAVCRHLAPNDEWRERRRRRRRRLGQADPSSDVAQVVYAKRGGRVSPGQHGAFGPAAAHFRTGGRSATAAVVATLRGSGSVGRSAAPLPPAADANATARYRAQTCARNQGKHCCCRSPDLEFPLLSSLPSYPVSPRPTRVVFFRFTSSTTIESFKVSNLLSFVYCVFHSVKGKFYYITI